MIFKIDWHVKSWTSVEEWQLRCDFRHSSPTCVGERASAAAPATALFFRGRSRDPGSRGGLCLGPPPPATASSYPPGTDLITWLTYKKSDLRYFKYYCKGITVLQCTVELVPNLSKSQLSIDASDPEPPDDSQLVPDAAPSAAAPALLACLLPLAAHQPQQLLRPPVSHRPRGGGRCCWPPDHATIPPALCESSASFQPDIVIERTGLHVTCQTKWLERRNRNR